MICLVRCATLTGMPDLYRELGGSDPERLLALAGVPRAALSDPDLKIRADAVDRLYELAAKRTGAPDFALKLAGTRRLSNLGPVAVIARDQPDLRRALDVLGHYMWLHNEALSVTLEEAGRIAIVRLDYSGRGITASRQSRELTLGAFVRVLRDLLGPQWRPESAHLCHPASDGVSVGAYRRVLGVRPQFQDAFDGISVRTEDLDRPLPAADPAMARQAKRFVEQLSSERGASWISRVEDMIVLLLPTGRCSVEEIARYAGVDRRTVHRRLTAEGSSFRHLLSERRAHLARYLIRQGRTSAAVADLVGFSSPSAFTHWFRGRFGYPPRRLAAQSGGAGDRS